MKVCSQRRRGRWLGVAFALIVAVAAHGLGGGSAKAASIDVRSSRARPVVLAGFTSQHFPVFFKIAGDGRVALTSGIAIRMKCNSGAEVVVPDEFVHIPIGANGTLHASFVPPTTTQNGVTSGGTDTLTARLARTHSSLTGTWRLKVHVSMAGGQTVVCDSRPVRFTATG